MSFYFDDDGYFGMPRISVNTTEPYKLQINKQMELQQIFETTKEQRTEFTYQLIERLNAGELDPLKTHLQVKALEDMLETLKANKDYKDAVLQAAVLNG